MTREVFYWIIFVVQIFFSVTSYIPQIVKLIKVKNSTGVSMMTWFISLFDFGSYQLLLILDDVSLVLQILNLLQLVQICIILVLIKRYSNKKIEQSIINEC